MFCSQICMHMKSSLTGKMFYFMISPYVDLWLLNKNIKFNIESIFRYRIRLWSWYQTSWWYQQQVGEPSNDLVNPGTSWSYHISINTRNFRIWNNLVTGWFWSEKALDLKFWIGRSFQKSRLQKINILVYIFIARLNSDIFLYIYAPDNLNWHFNNKRFNYSRLDEFSTFRENLRKIKTRNFRFFDRVYRFTLPESVSPMILKNDRETPEWNRFS